VLIGHTHDFYDPAKGKAVALSQIARGSRVVFQVASECGLGAIEAAREKGVWAIGVDVDQSGLGPHVLTSALKRLDVAVFATIEALARGTLQTGGTSAFSLRSGGVGLGAFSAVVPEPVRGELAAVEAAIAAGSIAIPTTL
jgi:basic membrane protein A